MNWTKRNIERVRLDIIKDLIKYDLLTCRPISAQRRTRPLAEVWQAVANEETRTMATMNFPTSSQSAQYWSKKP